MLDVKVNWEAVVRIRMRLSQNLMPQYQSWIVNQPLFTCSDRIRSQIPGSNVSEVCKFDYGDPAL
jgi:hypothetical protein